MAKAFRWHVGFYNGTVNCHFDHSAIRNKSVVLVSVSQGEGGGPDEPSMSTNPPGRFLGSARMSVSNISPRLPRSGPPGVDFRITVDWFEPLSVWVDIFVADEEPQNFVRSR